MASTQALAPRLGRPAQRRLLADGGFGLLIAVLTVGLTLFVERAGMLLGAGAALFALVIVWFAATEKTPLALALFMIYLGALDGFLKLATGSALVTLVRDVLLFAIVAGVLVRAQIRGTKLSAPPLTAWVAGFALLVVIQLFNPQGGTFAHSLGGVRQHLEFVPLFFLSYAFVRTTKALRMFVVILLLLAAANGAVSWVQFNLTPAQLATWGPGYAERVLGQGEFSTSPRVFYTKTGPVTRPLGLGSEAGSGGIVGAFALGGIIALASLVGRRRYLLFAVAMALGAIVAIVTSQGRGVIVTSAVIVLAYGVLTARSRGRAQNLVGVGVAAILALLVIQAVVGTVGSSGLRYKDLTPSTVLATTREARRGNLGVIAANIATYPLGAGLATAGPASRSPGATVLTTEVNAESELSFLTIETGVGGMLLLVGFTIWLFVLGVTRCRHEPDQEARMLLAAIIAPIAGMIALYYPNPVTPTTPAGPYLWAIAGIVSYWLVTSPAERARAAAAVAAP
jgi:hypothetical protein